MARRKQKALIVGSNGFVGGHLSRELLSAGYEVHGVMRRSSVRTTSRIDGLLKEGRVTLHNGDLTDSSSLIRVIGEVRPDEIYNLAAQSHVGVSFDAAEYTSEVDAVGVLRILEAVRILGLGACCRIYQASTSELYGKVVTAPPE